MGKQTGQHHECKLGQCVSESGSIQAIRTELTQGHASGEGVLRARTSVLSG